MLMVNLLPWRERRLQQRRRQTRLLLSIIITLVLLSAMMLIWRSEQQLFQAGRAVQHARQQLLQLQQLQKQQRSLRTERDALHNAQRQRQRIAQQFQQWHRFWQQLPALLPDTLWLARIERQQQTMLMEGWSESMGAIDKLRQKLLREPLFATVRQGAVIREPGGRYRFTLRMRIQELPDE